MTTQKLTCTTGIKKNIIKKEVFDRELELCKKLAKENKGRCGWGVCKQCGVLPLLIKLHQGVLLDKPEDISAVKYNLLK